jgi:arylsulfatase A-like enzyme
MSVLNEVYRHLRHRGVDAFREVFWRTYLRHVPSSDPDRIFEEEWDLLVVLDACRLDLFETVVSEEEYATFSDVDARTSTASTTTEWFQTAVSAADPESLAETAFICGNPYTDEYLDQDAFALLDEVWRYGWDDDRGTIPPRPLTDRAIQVARETDHERYVVHYMQPHFPSLADEDDAGVALDRFGDVSMSVWDDLRFGIRSEASVLESYRENLRHVLDDVGLLLENVDADRVVITSDHGNAIGEYGIYGHAAGIVHPALREVPQVVTSATDTGSYEPSVVEGVETADATVESRLEALGYS